MDVLIVGGTRFVGYQLTWRLLAAGHRVTLLNRGTNTDPFGDHVERLKADRTTDAFPRALAGRAFDACVDLAAYSGPDARGVIEALRDRVGHYVMISTGQVYLGRDRCPRPARESDYEGSLVPEPADESDHEEWAYGVNKREAEDVLDAAWQSDRFPSTRLRIPMVNGERDHFRRIESYLWRMLDRGPMLVPDAGARPVRHVYSGSVVRAIDRMLGDARVFGRVYNLAQEETPTLLDMLQVLAELIGAGPEFVGVPSATIREAGLDVVAASPFSGRWMSFLDPALAREEIGFRHDPLVHYLDKIVTAFLDRPPASPPDGYAQRPAEVRLASAWRS